MSLEEKFAKLALSLDKKKGKKYPELAKIRKSLELALPEGTSIESIKDWIPRVVESLRTDNPAERLSDREGKIWRYPPNNYALVDSNMQDRKLNIAELITSELEIHGRQTPTELVKHLAGIQSQLLVMTYIMMLNDNYLKWYEDDWQDPEDHKKGKVRTLELVEIPPEEQMAQQKKKELEDKKAKKKKRKSKKSVLERIKIIENTNLPPVEYTSRSPNLNRMRQVFE